MKVKVVLISLIGLMFWSCSTKKNTGMRRTYHNLTARYNVYFNGKESYKEGMLSIEENLEDNYSEVLNVFIYDDPSASSVGSQMQRAQKKAGKLIKRHSITVKPKRKKGKKTKKEKEFYARKEFNNWVDNANLLMGKAYFVEKQYRSAEESFTWILSEYPNMETRYDAQIWLARTYIQTKDYNKALDYLQRAEAEKDFPEKRLNKELFATYADYNIKQKRYAEALPWLELLLEERIRKFDKRRYKYIMAQIYQMQGEDKKASELYKEVIKMRPPYDMEFSAKIQRATLFDKNSGDSKEIRKHLDKMLRDEKNKEFRDQIYYALAEIDIKENDEPAAIDNYKMSAYTSVSNNNQKALSYLALADIYFAKLDYVNSKAYYDSTVMNLPKTNARFDEVSKMSKDLTELVDHVIMVETQDSLLQMAEMPKGERDRIIAELIQEIIEEERRLAEEQRQRQLEIAQYNETNRPGMQNNATPGGKWYFYNPAAIGIGQADFARKWGERRLEDNWRRKNKTVVNFDMFAEEGEEAEVDSTMLQYDPKSKEYYLSQLPLTDSAKVVAHEKIEEALFKLARVYREQFVDYDKSIETYLELLKRYPDTEYRLEAAYQLYQLYELQKQTDKSAFYKTLILKDYPNSVPAKILTDPNYLARMEAEKNKTKGFYTKAFEAFQKRNFNKVISYCEHVEQNNPETPLMPKFDLLKAQSIGATGNVDVMKQSLTKLTEKYPDTEEQALAEFMLSRIEAGGFKNFVAEGQTAYQSQNNQTASAGQSGSNTQAGNNNPDAIIEEIEPENIYQYQAEKAHFYVMAATGKISDLNRLKYNIIKYNLDHFLMFDFMVSDRKLTQETKLIIVKPLNDAKEAYKYLKLIRRNQDVYSEFNSLTMKQFIITEDNLKILQKEKDLTRYLMFFDQNYEK